MSHRTDTHIMTSRGSPDLVFREVDFRSQCCRFESCPYQFSLYLPPWLMSQKCAVIIKHSQRGSSFPGFLTHATCPMNGTPRCPCIVHVLDLWHSGRNTHSTFWYGVLVKNTIVTKSMLCFTGWMFAHIGNTADPYLHTPCIYTALWNHVIE